jgi:hypothetical protein
MKWKNESEHLFFSTTVSILLTVLETKQKRTLPGCQSGTLMTKPAK